MASPPGLAGAPPPASDSGFAVTHEIKPLAAFQPPLSLPPLPRAIVFAPKPLIPLSTLALSDPRARDHLQIHSFYLEAAGSPKTNPVHRIVSAELNDPGSWRTLDLVKHDPWVVALKLKVQLEFEENPEVGEWGVVQTILRPSDLSPGNVEAPVARIDFRVQLPPIPWHIPRLPIVFTPMNVVDSPCFIPKVVPSSDAVYGQGRSPSKETPGSSTQREPLRTLLDWNDTCDDDGGLIVLEMETSVGQEMVILGSGGRGENFVVVAGRWEEAFWGELNLDVKIGKKRKAGIGHGGPSPVLRSTPHLGSLGASLKFVEDDSLKLKMVLQRIRHYRSTKQKGKGFIFLITGSTNFTRNADMLLAQVEMEVPRAPSANKEQIRHHLDNQSKSDIYILIDTDHLTCFDICPSKIAGSRRLVIFDTQPAHQNNPYHISLLTDPGDLHVYASKADVKQERFIATRYLKSLTGAGMSLSKKIAAEKGRRGISVSMTSRFQGL